MRCTDKKYWLKRVKELEATYPSLRKKGKGMTFKEALKKTLEQHADVIRALANN
ncbi:hypothetical protein LDR16_001118 [Salmonella enterica]|nr:hypothetical protein [Salmonella enterica]EIE5967845.1 hypothetical protein [Salmonella enterica]